MTIEIEAAADSNVYWNEYYRTRQAPGQPSAFAQSVAALASEFGTVVELGCGNGRDSAFFLTREHRVFGLDSCSVAIAACEAMAGQMGEAVAARAHFHAVSASDPQVWQGLAEAAGGPLLVYARFMFHAVPEETETAVLDQVRQVLGRLGGALACEFRTPHDEPLAKAMPAHFRRYVDPDRFCEKLTARGMRIVERVEGQGMAVFGDEDAYVARIHARP